MSNLQQRSKSNRVGNPNRTVNFLRAYKFGDNKKDPIIDRIRTCLDDAGQDPYDNHRAGGPSPTTMIAWFEGETRRPQFATICAALHASGHEFVVAKTDKHVNGKDWKAEPPRFAASVKLSRHP